MKKVLIIGGIGLAAYGLYDLMKKRADAKASKKNGCGCGCGGPAIVKNTKPELYPDAALERYDASFRAIFPTPTGRLGQGPLPLDNAQSFVESNLI